MWPVRVSQVTVMVEGGHQFWCIGHNRVYVTSTGLSSDSDGWRWSPVLMCWTQSCLCDQYGPLKWQWWLKVVTSSDVLDTIMFMWPVWESQVTVMVEGGHQFWCIGHNRVYVTSTCLSSDSDGWRWSPVLMYWTQSCLCDQYGPLKWQWWLKVVTSSDVLDTIMFMWPVRASQVTVMVEGGHQFYVLETIVFMWPVRASQVTVMVEGGHQFWCVGHNRVYVTSTGLSSDSDGWRWSPVLMYWTQSCLCDQYGPLKWQSWLKVVTSSDVLDTIVFMWPVRVSQVTVMVEGGHQFWCVVHNRVYVTSTGLSSDSHGWRWSPVLMYWTQSCLCDQYRPLKWQWWLKVVTSSDVLDTIVFMWPVRASQVTVMVEGGHQFWCVGHNRVYVTSTGLSSDSHGWRWSPVLMYWTQSCLLTSTGLSSDSHGWRWSPVLMYWTQSCLCDQYGPLKWQSWLKVVTSSDVLDTIVFMWPVRASQVTVMVEGGHQFWCIGHNHVYVTSTGLSSDSDGWRWSPVLMYWTQSCLCDQYGPLKWQWWLKVVTSSDVLDTIVFMWPVRAPQVTVMVEGGHQFWCIGHNRVYVTSSDVLDTIVFMWPVRASQVTVMVEGGHPWPVLMCWTQSCLCDQYGPLKWQWWLKVVTSSDVLDTIVFMWPVRASQVTVMVEGGHQFWCIGHNRVYVTSTGLSSDSDGWRWSPVLMCWTQSCLCDQYGPLKWQWWLKVLMYWTQSCLCDPYGPLKWQWWLKVVTSSDVLDTIVFMWPVRVSQVTVMVEGGHQFWCVGHNRVYVTSTGLSSDSDGWRLSPVLMCWTQLCLCDQYGLSSDSDGWRWSPVLMCWTQSCLCDQYGSLKWQSWLKVVTSSDVLYTIVFMWPVRASQVTGMVEGCHQFWCIGHNRVYVTSTGLSSDSHGWRWSPVLMCCTQSCLCDQYGPLKWQWWLKVVTSSDVLDTIVFMWPVRVSQVTVMVEGGHQFWCIGHNHVYVTSTGLSSDSDGWRWSPVLMYWTQSCLRDQYGPLKWQWWLKVVTSSDVLDTIVFMWPVRASQVTVMVEGGHQFWCIGHNRVYVTSTGLSSDSHGWRWSPVLMCWTQSCLCDQYGPLKWQWWLKVVTSSDVLDTIMFMWPVRASQVTVMVEGGHQFWCTGHNRVYVTSTGLSSDSDGWRWSPVLMCWTQSCLCDQYGPLKWQSWLKVVTSSDVLDTIVFTWPKVVTSSDVLDTIVFMWPVRASQVTVMVEGGHPWPVLMCWTQSCLCDQYGPLKWQWWLKVVTSSDVLDTIMFMWPVRASQVTVMVEGGHQFWCIGHNRVYVTSTGLSSDSDGWRWSPVLMCWTQSCLCDQYGPLKWQWWLKAVLMYWTQSCLCDPYGPLKWQWWLKVVTSSDVLDTIVFMWPVRVSQVTVMVEGGHQFWCVGHNRVYVTSTGLSSDSDGWRLSPVLMCWTQLCLCDQYGLSSDSDGWRWSPVLMCWTQSCLCDQYGSLKWQSWLKVVTSSDVLYTIVFMWPVRASQVTGMVEGCHQFWCIGHNRVYVTSTGLSSDSHGWRWSPVLMCCTQSCLCDQYGPLKWQWWLKVVTSSDVLDTIVFMWPVRVSQVTVMVEGGHQFWCIGHNHVYVTSTGLSSDSDGWRWSPVLMYWTQSCLRDQYGPLKWQWWLKVVTSSDVLDTIVFMWPVRASQVTVMVEGGHQFWCIGHNRVYVTSTGLSSDSHGWRWSPVLMCCTQSCLCDQYGPLKWQSWLKVVTSSDVLDTIVFMWPVSASQVTVMVEGGHQFWCIGHNRVYVTSTGLSSDSDGWRWSPVLMCWTQSCLCDQYGSLKWQSWLKVVTSSDVLDTIVFIDQYGPLKWQSWLKVVTSSDVLDTIVFMWPVRASQVTVMVEGGHPWPVLMCWTQSCLCDQYGPLKWQWWLKVVTSSDVLDTIMFMWPVRASQVTVMVEGGHQFWCIGHNRVYVTSTGLSSDSDGWRWSPVLMCWTQSCLCDQYGPLKWQSWLKVVTSSDVLDTIVFMWPVRVSQVTVMVEGGHQFWCVVHNRVYVTSTGLSSDSHGWRWSPVLMYWTQSCLCDQYRPLKWQWWLKVVTSSDVLDTIVFMWPVRVSQVTLMVEGGHQFWCIGHNRVYVTSTGLSSDSHGWRWSPVLMCCTQSCLCDQYGPLKWQWWLKVVTSSDVLDTIVFMWPVRPLKWQWWLKVVTSSDVLDTIVFMWPVRVSQVTVMVEGGHQFWCVVHNRVYVTSTGLSSDSDGWRLSPVLMYWTQSCLCDQYGSLKWQSWLKVVTSSDVLYTIVFIWPVRASQVTVMVEGGHQFWCIGHNRVYVTSTGLSSDSDGWRWSPVLMYWTQSCLSESYEVKIIYVDIPYHSIKDNIK